MHSASGSVNENAVTFPGHSQTHWAEALHEERAEQPNRVEDRRDRCRMGVVSTLQKWGEEGGARCRDCSVNVGERARDADKFLNVRAEMWWNVANPVPNQLCAARIFT